MIYLDHHATTPCDPRVVETMLPYFTHHFGNASSPHEAGRIAYEAVEKAREQVAELINAQPQEIFWTSGATEANNLAILGLARGPYAQRLAPHRRRIVISAIEHKAVQEPCRVLQDEGFEVMVLPVETDGQVNLNAAQQVINEQTLFVSLQAANGEMGTIQPVVEMARLAHEAGALLHCDAAQAVGKIPVDVLTWDVDLLSLSGHKIYGPKGVGALYIRRGLNSQLVPHQHGGGQERGLRPGTLPVPLLAGLGEACFICQQEMFCEAVRIATLRDRLEMQIQDSCPAVRLNGSREARLPHNSSLTIPGISGDILLAQLPNIALSTGSACESGAMEPSKVLQAIGLSREDAASTVRIGLGRFTTMEEIEQVVQHVIEKINNQKTRVNRPE
jgi:cysteine desulfurase